MKFKSVVIDGTHKGYWVAVGYLEKPKLFFYIFQYEEDIIVLLNTPSGIEWQETAQTSHKRHFENLLYYRKRNILFQLKVFQSQYSLVIKDTTLTQVINLLTQQFNAVINLLTL